MRRGILIVSVACGAVIALAPGAASGGHGDATIVTYTGSPGEGSEISVVAAPGVRNRVGTVFVDQPTLGLRIMDEEAGVLEDSPFCTQESPTEVNCLAQGLQSLRIETLDEPDRFITHVAESMDTQIVLPLLRTDTGTDRDQVRLGFKPADVVIVTIAQVRGGGGRDDVVASLSRPSSGAARVGGASGLGQKLQLLGGGDKDGLKIKSGRGKIKGGGAGDRLEGGRGRQKIFGNGGNDRISCGKGKDKADGGPGKDKAAVNCEQGADLEIYLPDF
jgi:hypothetical protein